MIEKKVELSYSRRVTIPRGVLATIQISQEKPDEPWNPDEVSYLVSVRVQADNEDRAGYILAEAMDAFKEAFSS